jgi:hypothetical protein
MLIVALKKILTITTLCSSGMIFMFIPKGCWSQRKPFFEVDVVESFQYVNEEVLNQEEPRSEKTVVESEICISAKE